MVSSYALGRCHNQGSAIMSIKIGRHLEIDLRDRYFSCPFIGSAHHGLYGWVFDSWSEIRRIDRMWEERRRQKIAELED
jgi:hypothetical protein